MITAILALGMLGLGLGKHAKAPAIAKAALGVALWGMKRNNDLDLSSEKRNHRGETMGEGYRVVELDGEMVILTIDEIERYQDAQKLYELGLSYSLDVEWLKKIGRKRMEDPLFQLLIKEEEEKKEEEKV